MSEDKSDTDAEAADTTIDLDARLENRMGPSPVWSSERRHANLGLVLGGGAARGWAHIGVFHALNEEGIVPDIITGTSIGALVGGCALAGKLNELEKFARGLTRRRMMGLMDFSLSGSGLINGARLLKLLHRHLGDVQIEDLPKPYSAVSTELGTGHEIWLREGSIVRAMHASFALPGIFHPVEVHGRWLVDGALVNPVPVSVSRALGARMVIAVNLAGDSFARGAILANGIQSEDKDPNDEMEFSAADLISPSRAIRHFVRRQFSESSTRAPGVTQVMFEAYNIIQDRISRSRLAGDPPDVMVTPRLSDVGHFEFYKADSAIEAGYVATKRVLDDIKTFSRALS